MRITKMILLVCNRRSCILYFFIITAFSYFCILSSPAFSEVYQWTDEKGNSFYSDSPPPGVNAKRKKLRIDKIEKPEVEIKAAKDTARKRDLRDITVILYATDW